MHTHTHAQKHMDALLARYPALETCAADIQAAFTLLLETFEGGGKLLVCGNGGSAADSEHIVGELMKGFLLKRKLDDAARKQIASAAGDDADYINDNLQGGLPAISLVSHSALSTAFSNDVAPDMVFAQQVYGYAKPNDVLIGISTSGHSKNVSYAVKVANALGAHTIALTGAQGNEVAAASDVAIRVPSDETPAVQEYHLPVYHALCAMVEAVLFE